jgi:agmatinase
MTGFAFTSQATFLRAPVPQPQSPRPFGVAGIAWDGCVTNRPGARFGPRSIREASHMLCDGTHPLFDVDLEGALSDHGDLPLPNTSLDAMRAAMGPLVAPMIQGQRMAWLGGDHSITLPLLRAYRAQLGQPLAVVHFDAHCDTWTDHFGEPSGHGTWVYEAIQEGLVLPACFTQIGIRSAGVREARDYVRDQGGQIYTGRDMRGLERLAELQTIVESIRTRWAAHDCPPLYLSLDIDCLDPAFAPGTGTPEPAGLSTNQLFTLIEELCQMPFVGMDCVEVAPAYDHAELTSSAAAQAVWTWLCGQRKHHPHADRVKRPSPS